MRLSRDAHARKPFRLLALGGAALIDGGGANVVEQRRRLALLALIASGRGKGVSRDKLVSYLSPESSSESAQHALHQLLYYLRQQAGEDVLLGTNSMRLNPDVLTSDVVEFEDSLDRGKLEAAVALYRGQFLDGFHIGDSAEFEQWAAAERARLAARYHNALFHLAAAADGRNDHSAAIGWWTKLTAIDPLGGRAALGLIRAYAAAGDVPSALRHAATYESIVRAEFGTEPAPELAACVAELETLARKRPAEKHQEASDDALPSAAGAPDTRGRWSAGALGLAPIAASAAAVFGLRRFQSARELSDALRIARGHRTTTVRVSRRRRTVYMLAAAVVAVGLVGVLIARRAMVETADIPSLAILPFATAPDDTANAYLGIGIAEQLLDALSDMPGLRVISRTSSFALGPSPNVEDIGRRLHASAVLEGSVTRSGSTIHVAARLIDPAHDTPLWSQHFDEPISGVADVQEKIAKSIVEKLRIRLASDSATIVHRRSRGAEAHDLVLRARYLMRGSTRAGKLAAASLLTRAEVVDSTYAEVAAIQALVFEDLAVFREQDNVPGHRELAPGEALRLARLAAERAVRLDTLSSTAHTALGMATFRYDWNWARADREFRRAIELNPTASSAYVSYARLLRSMGRFDEARRNLDRAATLENDPRANALTYGRISYFAGEFARSERELAGADHADRIWAVWYADALSGMGRLAAAESLLANYGALDVPATFAARVYVLARMRRTAEARELLRTGRNQSSDAPILLAGALVELGDTTAALNEIERAVTEHDPLVVDLAVDPRLDPLRGHPRFVRIMNRLRLPRVR